MHHPSWTNAWFLSFHSLELTTLLEVCWAASFLNNWCHSNLRISRWRIGNFLVTPAESPITFLGLGFYRFNGFHTTHSDKLRVLNHEVLTADERYADDQTLCFKDRGTFWCSVLRVWDSQREYKQVVIEWNGYVSKFVDVLHSEDCSPALCRGEITKLLAFYSRHEISGMSHPFLTLSSTVRRTRRVLPPTLRPATIFEPLSLTSEDWELWNPKVWKDSSSNSPTRSVVWLLLEQGIAPTVCSGHYDAVSLKLRLHFFALLSKTAKELRLSQAQAKKLVKNFGNLSFISTDGPFEYFLLKAAMMSFDSSLQAIRKSSTWADT